MLSDMELLRSALGMLFFPLIAAPTDDTQVTRTIPSGKEYYQPSSANTPNIHLYQISPVFPLASSQQRLRAILDRAPPPTCQNGPNQSVRAHFWRRTPSMPHTQHLVSVHSSAPNPILARMSLISSTRIPIACAIPVSAT